MTEFAVWRVSTTGDKLDQIGPAFSAEDDAKSKLRQLQKTFEIAITQQQFDFAVFEIDTKPKPTAQTSGAQESAEWSDKWGHSSLSKPIPAEPPEPESIKPDLKFQIVRVENGVESMIGRVLFSRDEADKALAAMNKAYEIFVLKNVFKFELRETPA